VLVSVARISNNHADVTISQAEEDGSAQRNDKPAAAQNSQTFADLLRLAIEHILTHQ